MKQTTTIGALISLTALLSGCEKQEDMNLGGCDVGGLQVQAIYHQRSGQGDNLSLEFYKDGKIVGSVKYVHGGDWVQCDDNRKLTVISDDVTGGQKVYFSHSPSPEKK